MRKLTHVACGLAVAAGLFGLSSNADAASKSCTCVMSTGGWNSGIVKSLGHIASYRVLDVFAPRKCSQACSDRTSGQAGVNELGGVNNACALLNWHSACVRGYGYIGYIGTSNADGTTGAFTCVAPKPAVTALKCPVGWAANTTNQDGGITSDGKCKKFAGTLTVSPYPANGTPLGTWGFSWGNGMYAWGTTANGGAPHVIVITPAQPGSASFSAGC